MYYILYEGLKIESNEPVYCTVYSIQCTMYSVYCTLDRFVLIFFSQF